jgi:predicted acetyltransferase
MASKQWSLAIIATHPEHRGKGLAKEVLTKTIEDFKSKNLIYSTWAAENNLASIKVLESCGLRMVDRRIFTKRPWSLYVSLKYSL